MTKTNRSTLKLFGSYYLVQNFDFFINWVSESPRFSLPKTSKQPLPAFTPSISGKTRGDGEKWLWYLDSAPVNYLRSDSLVLAFWLAETCVISTKQFPHENSDSNSFHEIVIWIFSEKIVWISKSYSLFRNQIKIFAFSILDFPSKSNSKFLRKSSFQILLFSQFR